MKTTLTLRWMGRIWSIASLTLLALFAAGGGEGGGVPTAREVVALGFFPVGIGAGLVLGWWREGLGGAITAVSLALFYLWLFIVDGRLPRGPYFFLFAAPGFIFLTNWIIERLQRRATTGTHCDKPRSRPV